jgi:hypothetical protein
VELILRRGGPADQAMAGRTLDAMGEGGMFDHLGGGFCRYSVDEKWLIPHFEKMLYDNALLAACYLEAYQATGREPYRVIARETLDYLLRDLRDPAGGFHSSEDADSEGQEGRFYVFTPRELQDVLGASLGERFGRAYGVTPQGNFEHGASVLHRFEAPPDLDWTGLDEARVRLRAYRDARVRPGKDDKVLAAWNGLALTALSRGFQVLGEARYLEAATGLARFLDGEMRLDGGLARTWRRGRAHTPGFLEDYAAVAGGLVDLYEAGFDPGWLRWAGALAETMRSRFEDPAQGGFFATQDGGDDLLFRQKPLSDGALPSGNTLAARALLKLAGHLERPEFRASAEGVLRCAAPLAERAPGACLGLLQALDELVRPAVTVVLGGAWPDPATRALLAALPARLPDLPGGGGPGPALAPGPRWRGAAGCVRLPRHGLLRAHTGPGPAGTDFGRNME